MTADEALAEVGKVNTRLRELDRMLRRAVRDPASRAVPLLHQEIADAMASRDHLMQFVQNVLVDGEATAQLPSQA
jgi:hypothetical protein